MTRFWNQNSGPDATVVFLHDNVSLFSASSDAVKPFDIRFQLDQPFTYDPQGGHLAMLLATPGPPIGSSPTRIDAESFGSLGTSPSGAVTPNFIAPTGYGLITEFRWIAVPEPRPSLLIITSILVLLLAQIRKKEATNVPD